MVLFIHVGFHKTGSTSVQKALSRQSRSPRSRLDFIPVGSGPINHDEVSRAIEKALSVEGKPLSIISDERLLGNYKTGYARVEEFIETLAPVVRGNPFRVVAVVRPHYEWYYSAFAQLVRSGRGLTEARSWLTDSIELKRNSWKELVHKLDEGFSSEAVDVLPMSSEIDAVRQFFDYLNLTTGQSFRAPSSRENASLPMGMVLFHARLNELGHYSAASYLNSSASRLWLGNELNEFGLGAPVDQLLLDFERDEWESVSNYLYKTRPDSQYRQQFDFAAKTVRTRSSALEFSDQAIIDSLARRIEHLNQNGNVRARLLAMVRQPFESVRRRIR